MSLFAKRPIWAQRYEKNRNPAREIQFLFTFHLPPSTLHPTYPEYSSLFCLFIISNIIRVLPASTPYTLHPPLYTLQSTPYTAKKSPNTYFHVIVWIVWSSLSPLTSRLNRLLLSPQTHIFVVFLLKSEFFSQNSLSALKKNCNFALENNLTQYLLIYF